MMDDTAKVLCRLFIARNGEFSPVTSACGKQSSWMKTAELCDTIADRCAKTRQAIHFRVLHLRVLRRMIRTHHPRSQSIDFQF
mmetsp:Transcript_23848/g.59661  ORF Transcript_23848/g.59661 Transcript_23848/m.59661 type:complete len:83 (+) Transcript_23848:154-402(+)